MSEPNDPAGGRGAIARQPFSALLEAELEELTPTRAVISLEVTARLLQEQRVAHGGAISYLADNSIAFAGGRALDRVDVLTSGYAIEFLRPAPEGAVLVAIAEIVHRGRTGATVRCEVIDRLSGRVVAVAQGRVSVPSSGDVDVPPPQLHSGENGQHVSPTIRELSAGEDLKEIVALSLRAWEPVFRSFRTVLGGRIFGHLYPDWRATQAGAVRNACSDPANTVLVSTQGSVLTGFAVLMREDDPCVGVLEMIAVDPPRQGRGHGRLLLEAGASWFAARGVDVLNVNTGGDRGHAPARRLYESAGFVGLPLVTYYRDSARRYRWPRE